MILVHQSGVGSSTANSDRKSGSIRAIVGAVLGGLACTLFGMTLATKFTMPMQASRATPMLVSESQSHSLWEIYWQTLEDARYVDLTHSIEPSMPRWPGFSAPVFRTHAMLDNVV
eukprot:2318917-Pleurochrysis_carterae.AAC.1